MGRTVRSAAVWLVPALVMLVVGLAGIGTPELWRDEVSTWSAATRSLGDLFGLLGNVDASNGLYYLLMHAWTGVFGASPISLRLPSALAMAGTAAFTALTARKVFRSPVAGLAAGLLLATVPSISRYAQEARSYAMVTCAAAAATWCLVRALERPSAIRWAGFTVFTALAAVLHLVSLAGVAGQLPMVLVAALGGGVAAGSAPARATPAAVTAAVGPPVAGSPVAGTPPVGSPPVGTSPAGPADAEPAGEPAGNRAGNRAGDRTAGAAGKRRRVRWPILGQYTAALLVAVLPAVPLILVGRSQSDRQLSWLPEPPLYYLRVFVQRMFDSYSVLYAFLALAVPVLLLPGRRMVAVLMLALAEVPVLAVWLVSQSGEAYFTERYLLFTVPAWAALAGGGVAALYGLLVRLLRRAAGAGGAARSRRVLAAGLGLATVAAAVAVPAALAMPEQRVVRSAGAHTHTDFRGAAAVVAGGYSDGDGLVALGGDYAWNMIGASLSYYLPASVEPTPVFERRSAVKADDLYPVESTAPAADLGDAQRVWVVTIGTGEDPYGDLPAGQAEALRAVFTPTEVRHVRGLTVTLLVRSRR